MNIFFRVLLAIYAFCLAVFSAIMMYAVIKTDVFNAIYQYMDERIFSYNGSGPRLALFLTALLFFVLSLMFLLSGVKSNKDKKAISKHTNIGEVSISLNSIENIALNASRKAAGVKDTKAFVRKRVDNVSIVARIVVMPDMNIPAISEDVQTRVKKSVEDNAGINVSDVKVIVDCIYSGATYKSRVE